MEANSQTIKLPVAGGADSGEASKQSYGQVIKSSALIGAASLINVGLRIVRAKAMALIIGPAGVGLLGVYDSLTELTRNLAGLGINSSGVRQIAEATGSGDSQRIARTVTTLRRVALCSGALGSLLLLIFCKPVSRLTFGNEEHAGAVALLSLAAFFLDISAAQGALVQGMRRIADLARINVLGALYGTLLSIPIVYFMKERGIVPSLVAVAAMSIVTSWWYARKVKVEAVSITVQQTLSEASALVRLGLAFMSSALLAMGSAYLVRIIVLQKFGIEAAGYYQAAWALGGLYVGFILQAMGADFYPRLTAVANRHEECNRMVNEQLEVGLLLAGPGILGTLVFAPLAIDLFYSGKFAPAVEILRWFCLGMMLRVASWPMGFIVLAQGKGKVFLWIELVTNLIQVILAWGCVLAFGLKGSGIAFFGTYVFYCLLITLVARRLSGFRWSTATRRLSLYFAPLVALVFVSHYVLPPIAAIILGTLLTACTGVLSLRTLCSLVPLGRLPGVVRKLLTLARMAPPSPK